MTFEDVLKNARTCIGPYCKACTICNGKACRNQLPGPGAKGVGDNAIRNYEKWQEIRVNMDTICEQVTPDTSLELFGRKFRYPFFAGPVGAVPQHYSDKYDDFAYNNVLIKACKENGIAAFTGDGVNPQLVPIACEAIAKADGIGVPTIKPWSMEKIREKMEYCKASGAFAVAMDIDGAGLPFLKHMNPPAGSKTVEQLSEISKMVDAPFVIKGIMTVRGALKAQQAGAAGIIVSNHGGRVLDQCPATAEVLWDIVDALKGSGMKIFVDGGIRSGVDVLKALAIGADAVVIARPFVSAVYGGGEEGVKLYIEKIGAELADAMQMCGVKDLASITRDVVYRAK